MEKLYSISWKKIWVLGYKLIVYWQRYNCTWVNIVNIIVYSPSKRTIELERKYLSNLAPVSSPVFSWSPEKTGITSVSVFSHSGPNDPAFVRTTEVSISLLPKTPKFCFRSKILFSRAPFPFWVFYEQFIEKIGALLIVRRDLIV